ncbi:hypothetical protein [Devriesea agamarum]|uniref:hypothetical protein n=1 Tax=Devriesea agamarum TaxID=472569 RepID=UPI00071E581D|nr:hypothetical protein [Devriesea agamarum]
MHPNLPAPARILSTGKARQAQLNHQQRADTLTEGHRMRKARGLKHPVEDFLFHYYPFSPARMRRWHPGWDTAYDARADLGPRSSQRGSVRPCGDLTEDGRNWYVDTPGAELGTLLRRADVHRFVTQRADALAFMYRHLQRTSLSTRTPSFGCFGLHEWAMVYALAPGEKRHSSLELRLGQDGTDEVVRRERLQCTHVDAFRFFTPDAAPRNTVTPSRHTQSDLDNPACLHVGMDLFKWAMKLAPLVPSSLALDCFEHALAARILDMEASPYDVRPLGYGMVPIETPAGKAEYVRRQRILAEQAETLRQRLLDYLKPLADIITSLSTQTEAQNIASP